MCKALITSPGICRQGSIPQRFWRGFPTRTLSSLLHPWPLLHLYQCCHHRQAEVHPEPTLLQSKVHWTAPWCAHAHQMLRTTVHVSTAAGPQLQTCAIVQSIFSAQNLCIGRVLCAYSTVTLHFTFSTQIQRYKY